MEACGWPPVSVSILPKYMTSNKKHIKSTTLSAASDRYYPNTLNSPLAIRPYKGDDVGKHSVQDQVRPFSPVVIEVMKAHRKLLVSVLTS
jgi:hypothetical protein